MRASSLAYAINESNKCQYCKIVIFEENYFKFVCCHSCFRFGKENYEDENDEQYTLYFDDLCTKENERWCSVIRGAKVRAIAEKKKEPEDTIVDYIANKASDQVVSDTEEKDRKSHGAIKQ